MTSKFTFKANSGKVMDAIKAEMLIRVTKAAELIKNQAKMIAPVGGGVGQLRDTIDYNIQIKDDEIVGQIGSPLMYAIYNEFGTGEFAENGQGRKGGWAYKTPDGKWHFTKGMTPRPFLRPAFRQNKDGVKKILGRTMHKFSDGGDT